MARLIMRRINALKIGICASFACFTGAMVLGVCSSNITETFAGTNKTVYLSLGNAGDWYSTAGRNLGTKKIVAECYPDGNGSAIGRSAGTYVKSVGSYIYSFSIPEETHHFLFHIVENFQADGENSWWNNGWQTVDIGFSGDYDLYTLNTNSDGKWSGAWSSKPVSWDATVYFINGNSWSKPAIRSWGGAQGEKDVAMSKISDISLNAGGNSFEVWEGTLSASDTDAKGFLFHEDGQWNGQNQTGNQTPSDGSIYAMTVEGKYYPIVRLLLKVRSSLKDANIESDGGKTYTNSVCGIDETDKSAIISSYTALRNSEDSYVVRSVKNSTLTTYNPLDYTESVPVALRTILAQLGVEDNVDPEEVKFATATDSNTNNSLVVLVAAISLSTIAAAGYFLIRRRQQAN